MKDTTCSPNTHSHIGSRTKRITLKAKLLKRPNPQNFSDLKGNNSAQCKWIICRSSEVFQAEEAGSHMIHTSSAVFSKS